MTSRSANRRTVLAAAVAAAASAVAAPAALAADTRSGGLTGSAGHGRPGSPGRPGKASLVDLHSWTTHRDWASGETRGTSAEAGSRPGIVLATPAGSVEYADPHTGRKASWEYATWTSPRHKPSVAAGEVIASWNAHTPAGTWIRTELRGTYSDGKETPWYTMGIWTAKDGDDVPRRTSVDNQSDGNSSVYTDTFTIDDLTGGLRLASYQLRLTLYRAPGTKATPKVWRVSAMCSDLPDRFEVPASKPGLGRAVELKVPRYSQEIHKGQYPEYDNGGEAWCSPTSSQMIIEFWGRKPSAEDLAWVNPDYADPQVCHAARYTFDYQYEGCGNWPFNTAYASTYKDMQAVVTRLNSLSEAEEFIAAGIPLITSQSFIESELDGAGYGTAGHLMTVIGFTKSGDVIANDPNSPDNPSVRHVYKRRQFENIWLRTKRKDADGKVKSGTGGVCYLYFPAEPAPAQRRVLKKHGLR
ncbi:MULTISPECIES: peptidase C39 family protein [unclassified Streptomyces]|uniref:peptidase C39 family protein n=1 Tax=unclassified Streptomyces TaxID=2593676 RepID=UPI002DDAB330|nr:peptidase C39 family protein [Streptomyces sp. NBC_01775]WSB80798.1 peptidase C39 family protein [Streptomyces sp. NBC_01775]WSS39699.1 peptidase C39 family protein [Streptomyces sp. NBC_01187]